MSKIAIIVLHFGDKKNTFACLESIKKVDYPKNRFTVFIVDNGTGQLSSQELKSRLFPLKLIKISFNSGFSQGINAGIKASLKDRTVKYIFLLNNDVLLEHSALKLLCNRLENENIDLAGGVITYFAQPNKIWFAGGSLNQTFCFTQHKHMNKEYNHSLNIGKTDFITGAAMFIKREVFEKIGYFDEDYFLYWEDVDFCQRANRVKCKIICLNSIIAYHKVSSTSGLIGTNKLTPIKAYYFARNPFLFLKKNNLPVFTGFVGQMVVRLPYYFFSLTGINSLFQYLKGLWDGLKFLYLH